MSASTVRVIGFGMGPQHVTPEAADALRSCDYVLAAAKGAEDPLLAIRRAVCEQYGAELVAVPDPERDRDAATTTATAGYDRAVRAWHTARVESYRAVLEERGGTAGFLVWGDPALYDSTIRVVEQLGLPFDVIPGISAPQLLAARHRMVLHEVGRPVHLTTARRLREDIAAGQRNLVVMLGSAPDLEGLEDWQVWYGANLGAPGEQLAAGRLGDVGEASLRVAREHARAIDGWVMDLYLLRGPR
ncbi:precorrin 6A synthase [Nocardioides sp. BP30]|uniref:precorrin 6A synthase n=1 Tax=Nocardioides sp. BP30 TaxID=3036374 RepID=UPI0024686B8D|nr:precorrin 6A synthase [Nocardioides sp. BP30]WGL51262.1 precorrin 6A synthase [Nocardioides sp. BP30]